jgi:ATP-dependent RNA helicase DeaD
VRQVAYVVRRADKPAALDRILDMENPTSAIVFCRTRVEVDTLVETLNAHGYRAEALHGGMQQRQRDAVMARVRSNKTDLLIATDVAARGLDIEHSRTSSTTTCPPTPNRTCTDRTHGPRRTRRHGHHARRTTGTPAAALDRAHDETEDRRRDGTRPWPILGARRLEQTSGALRDVLTSGHFDDVRVVVESLARDFDVLDIAAAAVKMAHMATVGGG